MTPTGAIEALAFRGAWMGNRGILHDPDGTIRSPWRLQAWLICRTRFRDRRRAVMAPGRYTELFFLDEAHALAAGHRPCHECRRAEAHAFRDGTGHERVATLDAALHRERLEVGRGSRWTRSRRLHPTPIADMPTGAMALVGETAFLRRGDDGGPDDFVGWTNARAADRYHALAELAEGAEGAARDVQELRRRIETGDALAMLTPPTAARAIRGGYTVQMHPSARQDGAA